MPRNGSGTMTLPAGNPVVPGTVITSTWANTTLNDVASAITQSIAYDGQTVPIADLPLGNFKLTNVGNAIQRNQYAAYGQVQDGQPQWMTVTGTDTILGTIAPGPTGYVAGQTFRFVSAGTNTTNAVTLNINSLGAKSITRQGANALRPGDISSGAVIVVTYDGTQFQLISVSAVALANGQCRLSVTSTTTLRLDPYGGNTLIINAVQQQIPSSGVTYTLSGLSPNTTYYVYAFMNAGVMTLEVVTTTHATSTNGVEIKSGDATRTLVGMVRVNNSTQFVNTAAQRFCLNWYNRRVIHALNSFAALRSTTNTSNVEISTTERCEFLFWSGEGVFGTISGTTTTNAPAGSGVFNSALNLQASTIALATFASVVLTAGVCVSASAFPAGEGFTYFTLFGNAVSGFTTSWSSGLVISAQTQG